jgi:hypothetical protein
VIVVNVMGAVIWSTVAVFWVQGAVRTWRGTRNLSASPLFRVQSIERGGHIDRCAPCVAVLLVCVSVMFVAAIAAPDQEAATPAWQTTVIGLGFFGAAAALFLSLSVRYTTRPRCLVPPPLRTTPNK